MGIVTRLIRQHKVELGELTKLNILTCPTHEAYETNLCKTGHEFFAVRGEGIKDWERKYRPLPSNYTLLNNSIPPVDFDLVLSQNRFGQYPVLSKLAQELNLPLICLEHTLPVPSWPFEYKMQINNMRGFKNIYISEFSTQQWGAQGDVIHHGIDTEVFKPTNLDRKPVLLSVVNDWINRDVFCGHKLWQNVTQGLPVKPVGATPGLSEPAKSLEELVEFYNTHQIFLNTSLISPVPTSLMEAMACECAVVSTNTCMIPEVIEHGVSGFLCNTPEELRFYSEKLLNNPELCREMGKNARKRIQEKFGVDKFVNQWNTMFFNTVKEWK